MSEGGDGMRLLKITLFRTAYLRGVQQARHWSKNGADIWPAQPKIVAQEDERHLSCVFNYLSITWEEGIIRK